MDIQYLLFLQDFRNSIDNALTPFMEGVSMFAVTYLILFPVYYYWNRNKKDGLYALVAYYFCMVITPLVKLTACVYRPWIRDSRIVPAGKAIVTATGYSFPSGHTTTAAPLAGGMVVNTWKEPAAPRRLCFLLPRPRIYHAQAVPDGLYGRWQAPCRSAEDDERRIRRYRKDDGIYYRPVCGEDVDPVRGCRERDGTPSALYPRPDTDGPAEEVFQSRDGPRVRLSLGKTFLFHNIYVLLYCPVPHRFENVR